MTELDLLETRLAEAIEIRRDALVGGNVASWEEYKYLSGVVAGLEGALNSLREIKDKYEQE